MIVVTVTVEVRILQAVALPSTGEGRGDWECRWRRAPVRALFGKAVLVYFEAVLASTFHASITFARPLVATGGMAASGLNIGGAVSTRDALDWLRV